MKTTIETVDIEKEKTPTPEAPVLYQYIKNDKSPEKSLIVLFTGTFTGVVLQSDDSCYNVGEYDDGWYNCLNQTYWKRLPAGTKVIFEQE